MPQAKAQERPRVLGLVTGGLAEAGSAIGLAGIMVKEGWQVGRKLPFEGPQVGRVLLHELGSGGWW
jgi:hypothetical protein